MTIPMDMLTVCKTLTLVAVLCVLVSPGLAAAYIDPTGGGFLLQLILGGATAVILLVKVLWSRLLDRIGRRPRDTK